jgi:hypothetical protein
MLNTNRFKIEARSGYHNFQNWLVVYDKQTREYLNDGGPHKKHIRFKTSEDVVKYLSERGLM